MKYLYIIFFVLLAVPVFGYIDPGTGSMLFSFLTGMAVTVFFFIKNLILRIRTTGLLGKPAVKQTTRHSLVIYSEGKQYWNLFSPILEELAARGLPCVYYTSGEDDPGLSFVSPHVHTQFIGQGNTAYRLLNFLEADICLMTTPGLDVLQLKRSPGVSHYSHILHAVVDTGLYRLFSFDYFDSLLLTGEHQIAGIRELEKKRNTPAKELFVTGCTYLDTMAQHAQTLGAAPRGEDTKTVLVAPSWGQNGILKRYGMDMLEPLARSSYRLVIRPHPQSMISEKEVVERLRRALAGYENVSWNFDQENLRALSQADILISDFSGVIFDYVFLFGRPVLYPRFDFDVRPYDASDFSGECWTLKTIRAIGTPMDENSFSHIGAQLDAALRSGEKRDSIAKIREEAYRHPGEAGRRVVDVLEALGKRV
ncbi:MAG: CDP-glycerol glycerophosphotransferase family protein [Treponema sp.]|jgi:hypothetical protein|nr:CDP-glycerol glycerophosphotransferase family protein [Treponema sp.]